MVIISYMILYNIKGYILLRGFYVFENLFEMIKVFLCVSMSSIVDLFRFGDMV